MANRNCEQCGKPRDAGGACPTAAECSRLKAPHRRLQREGMEARQRAEEAERRNGRIGLQRSDVAAGAARVDPRQAARTAAASERTRLGWAGRRR